jgi:hypothetical protein
MKAFLFAVLMAFFLTQAGCSSITRAASLSKTEKVHQLVNEGHNINEQDSRGFTALMWAAYFSNYPLAKYLVDAGADLNIQDRHWDYTALMYAVYYNNTPIAEYLIEHGAELNLRERSGYSALGLARRNGNEKMEKLLRDKGAKE